MFIVVMQSLLGWKSTNLFVKMRMSIIASLAVVSGCTAIGAPPKAPDGLRVNDVMNPVGTGTNVYFGWWVNDPDDNEIQTGYQIQLAADSVFSELLWDSGHVAGRLQNHIAYGGAPLKSDQNYFWKVRTWDCDGNAGQWSGAAAFTVGLLDNEDWSGASWIRRDTSDADDYTYYRKKAKLSEKQIERATVYISAAHKYALYVNGTPVGKGPAYHYPHYQYYNAFDITEQLTPGQPQLFAIFNHWFGGGQGRPASERGLIMNAVIHYADGTSMRIGTDETWRQAKAKAWGNGTTHRNRGEGVGYVETIDSRKLIYGWNAVTFDDSSWDSATVVGPHPVEPWMGTLAPDLTRIEERVLGPVSVARQDDRYLVDLGKVYAGMPRIRFSGGKPGDRIEMLGGYALDSSGRINSEQNQSTDMRYFAVLNGGTFVFEPVEYLGMRYFEINNPPMPITKDNFQFIVRHSAMDTAASSFGSSDEMLNAVWDLMKHSLLTCAQEEFVDTPTREKGGFLGDAAIQSTVAMPVMNERALTRRVLHEFLQSMEQHWSGKGRLNAVYPNNDGARDIPDFTQSYLVWAWNYYMETGDRAFLAENYDQLKSIADYVDRHRNEKTGLITELTGGSGAYQYGIVDWPSSMRYGYDLTAARTVINGWAYADFDIVARMAETLGDAEDRDIYRRRAYVLKESMNAQLLKSSGVYVDGLSKSGSKSSHVSQHANMFPLALGMVPEEHRDSVVEEVKEQKMSVGMVTLPWLIRAIGEADEGEHLIELFTNEEWDGWAQCLAKGATATWESWDADTAGQSMSHAWGASGLEGYVRYILGIRPLKPQYEMILIKPLDCGSELEWAQGSIMTDRGPIAVHWKRNGKSYVLQVSIPVNTKARISIPRGTSSNPSMYLDGKRVDAVVEGEYLRIDEVGSGERTILRRDG